jgi:hypothetical protein
LMFDLLNCNIVLASIWVIIRVLFPNNVDRRLV